MRVDHWFLLLLAVAPAAYTWWSGRAIRRSLDDPTLPDLLLARQRRIVQVTVVAIIASAFTTSAAAFTLVALLGVLAAQYPIRRAVYGDTWSFAQYVRYTSFSFVAFGGLWLFPLIMTGIVVQLVQAWMPEQSAKQIMLGLALGIVAAAVYLVWHRSFVRVWLVLHQASPLDERSPHAALLPRFRAVLERAGARLPVHPTTHRYGAPGGQVVNAAALCSLNVRAVAMSDTLLANLDADEATAIFAHEIAHHEHYTDAVLRKRRLAAFMLAVCLAAIPALQLATGGRYTLAIDGLFLVAVIIFVARGQQGHRAHETECDLRAVELSGDADAVIRGLTRIHALSLVPRRFSQEFERQATHPSLARRIQAIRAHTAVDEPTRDEPTVVATTTPGAYVALDDARSHWFEGAPSDAPLDIGVLREQATSYRALAHRELGELRLVAERPRTLRAADLAGRSWSVGIRDEDVARVQAALDRVDVKLGSPVAEPKASGVNTARTVAAVLLIAAMLANIWGTTTFVTFIALFVPSVASLAAMAAMALGAALPSLASGGARMLHEITALVIVIGAALWSAFIARRWHRAVRDGSSREIATRQTVLWTRALYAVLAIGVVVSLLTLSFGGLSSPVALLGDPQTTSAAIAVLGLGAALIVARHRAWRLTGAALVALAAVGIAAGTLGERWSTQSTAIAWSTGRLSLVATVPIGSEVHEASMSPGGTRFLTRRWVGNDDVEGAEYSRQIVTGSIPLRGPSRTFTALDAALPNERDLLVLARSGDSLELRLERQDADSATRVAWRRAMPTLADPRLRLDARGSRWILSGHQRDGQRHRLATLSGAIDGTDVRQSALPADTLRGQPVFSFSDGATLVIGTSPSALGSLSGRSFITSYLAMLRGDALRWTLWRFDREGSSAVKTLRGYPTCAASTEDDVAVCVEQGRRSTRVWRIARDTFVDLGILSRRYERATASQGGAVVASSYNGRAIAIVDAARQRGIRTSLPAGDYSYVREISAANDAVLAVLGTPQGGLRLAVYRLETDAPAARM
ncbi:MAG TPA: M48 family metallopeptidase, partial [Gemmatimonadaceae bacterium]|nr:M48 family metallopeptidase [Gemmatimonadaceae bacterium]